MCVRERVPILLRGLLRTLRADGRRSLTHTTLPAAHPQGASAQRGALVCTRQDGTRRHLVGQLEVGARPHEEARTLDVVHLRREHESRQAGRHVSLVDRLPLRVVAEDFGHFLDLNQPEAAAVIYGINGASSSTAISATVRTGAPQPMMTMAAITVI